MIVEFAGPMGAGKTTLHAHTVVRLEGAGRRCSTSRTMSTLGRQQQLMARACASWRSRAVVALAARHLVASGRAGRDVSQGLRWLLTDLRNDWAARRLIRPDRVVLFDEGLIQRAINLFVHGRGRPDLSAVRSYARTVPLPDVLVYLRVAPGVARERARDRPSKPLQWRFRGLDAPDLHRVFIDTVQTLDALVGQVARAPGRPVTVLTLDATDPAQAAARLDARLDGLLRSRP
jgi:thymidylate kinase